MYNLIVRPLLFLIDPEKVHRMLLNWLKNLSLSASGSCMRKRTLSSGRTFFHTEVCDSKNRIGLSAGFDKKCGNI